MSGPQDATGGESPDWWTHPRHATYWSQLLLKSVFRQWDNTICIGWNPINTTIALFSCAAGLLGRSWKLKQIHRTCIYSLATEPEWVRCIDQIGPRLTRSSLFWSSWCITPRRPALALVELLVESEILSNFEMSLLCPTLAPGFRWFNLGWTKCAAAPWRTSTHASPSIQVACWAF